MSPQDFAALTPTLKQVTRDLYYGPLLAAMTEFEINTPTRIAAFLAQVMHESGCFRYWKEIWGPSAAQKRYEGRKDLGNTQPGDGERFMGRGPIQITGRANYKRFGELLQLPLLDDPEMLEQPEFGFRSAACYWDYKGLNKHADLDTDEAFKKITKLINGGYNGLDDRMRHWAKCKEVLCPQTDSALIPSAQPS